MNTIPNFPGYQITEQLYTGTRTLVYRGISSSDQHPVVIKILRNEYPNFNELVQFRNQYTIAKNLDFPHLVKPLTLETYHNSYALIMEDFGGVSLSEYLKIATEESQINKSLPLAEFLNIAIQLTDTLNYLYQNRVIHKDIKPANILINPDSRQIQLIDFSISSLLPRETQEIQNANALEGTLAYISPEQTGRMNRGIDYRSDFYSLGATFYELLTGELPFISEDGMELIHCHLAKHPIPINQINPEIPLVLSEIVSKLMAKNAEDRYQTALGIKHDLEKCLVQLQTIGKIEFFAIGKRDISDRFIIPEKLYGRETEVNQLLDAFERIATPLSSPLTKGGQRGVEMMLVAGFSGIGKTAVVNEVHKPIVRQRGYFIKGKYDQFQRNIPFSAFVQAFRDLMGQLLSESDRQLQTWTNKIIAAVGENGQVLIDVIPELENIIGKQPPATELSGNAAQNRFNLLMQKFVQVFTSKEHPLVMFLDDLQWSDSASLNLLKLLMQDTGYILILGAYRDNEVSPVHPFMLTVDEIIKNGVTVNTITLPPLSEVNLNLLVADTLNCELSIAQPLSKLVYQKTQGNPFFATQFLKALHDDKLISFDWDIQHWQCDISQVKALALTDDIVEFMALQLQKLSIETQNILKLAACIGAEFDLNTLVIVSENSSGKTATTLWKALQEGLVIPKTKVYKFFTQSDSEQVFQASANPTYRFLHDRVQQAAYSLIPEGQKQTTHLKIGQLLQSSLSAADQEEKLFDIVGHLNLSRGLLNCQAERKSLIQLNLKAIEKAKKATAYVAAREFVTVGLELLSENSWQNQYELSLNLHEMAAEFACLNGDFEEASYQIQKVLDFAQTVLDKVPVYMVQVRVLAAQNKFADSIAIAAHAITQLGIEFPSDVTPSLNEKALQDLAIKLEAKVIEDLVNLPVMTDPNMIASMKLLGMMMPTVFVVKPAFLPFVCANVVSLSLQFGNISVSGAGYTVYGMVLTTGFGQVERGYRFGKMALNLIDQCNARSYKCLTILFFSVFLQHRKEPISSTMSLLKQGYLAGIETGDFLYAGYCSLNYFYSAFYAGKELSCLQSELDEFRRIFASLKQANILAYLHMQHEFFRRLVEITDQPTLLIGDAYDETKMFPQYLQNNELVAFGFAYTIKLILAYVFGDYNHALDYINEISGYLSAIPGMLHLAAVHFYAGLTYLAVATATSEDEQSKLLALAEQHQVSLSSWAENVPMNHQHKVDLVAAEKCRVLGQKAEAIELYDKAITSAKENKFIQEEALANELAAKFYLSWGKEKFAAGYMQAAYYCYAKWGAKAKVIDLEKRYPQLLKPILQQPRTTDSLKETISRETIGSTHTATSISEALDLASLLKASQTISGEIELEKLLSSLLSILIENAGADKCVLMLLRGNHLLLEGLITVGTKPVVLQRIPVEDSQEIPLKLIYKVKHNSLLVVLLDATADPTLANDPYIMSQQPKSILCSPILHQGKLLGILYLENNLVTGAFTSDRVELINLLCAQAAISLENARLYEQSQAYSQQLEQAFDDLQQTQLQMIQSEKMSALGNLVAGVAHEINNPIGFLGGNIKPALDYIKDLFGLIDLVQQKYPQLDQEIQEGIETIELDYIREDLPKLIGSMKTGVDRIRDISTSLRTFSRADTDRPVAFKLHEGIDSTILILKHRLKPNETRPEIEIIKNYGSIPLVECYAGQLNQVFMNLLANAIDALDESNYGRSYEEIQANPNRITISTSLEDKSVRIAIADNGTGMPSDVKQRIFDHLFTTKSVGKGTGLGLAIARQIVEKHSGTIKVNSELGQGTEFAISLPIKSNHNSHE
jgi:predicted ATPase/signal transduction histidine kinase/tRNA A-37 threonylcarbamoyl transferase component Bud32